MDAVVTERPTLLDQILEAATVRLANTDVALTAKHWLKDPSSSDALIFQKINKVTFGSIMIYTLCVELESLISNNRFPWLTFYDRSQLRAVWQKTVVQAATTPSTGITIWNMAAAQGSGTEEVMGTVTGSPRKKSVTTSACNRHRKV